MEREELMKLNDYKIDELKKRLIPITDWNKVKKDSKKKAIYIFHESDTDIFIQNKFADYNEKDNIVAYYYRVFRNERYKYNSNKESTGWYYYDESIAKEVDKYWTPKLYIIKLPCGDEFIIIACNEIHLHKCFNDETSDDSYVNFEQFKNTFKYRTIENVGDFKIFVK